MPGDMKRFSIDELADSLRSCSHVVFSILFGSSVDGTLKSEEADIDLAIFLDTDATLGILDEIIEVVQKSTAHDKIDLSILNRAGIFLRFESLNGRLLSCDNSEIYSDFFSLTCRMYENEIMRIARNLH